MPGENIHVRTALSADIPDIVAICKNSLAATYGTFLDVKRMEPWIHGDAVDKYVHQSWRDMLVAEHRGEIVGVAGIQGNVIDLLWVRLDRRGEGVGATLLKQCEAQLSAHHDDVELECFEPNTESIRFYERHGYRWVRTFMDDMAGVNKVAMKKRIRPKGRS